MECGSAGINGTKLLEEIKDSHPTKAAKVVLMSELDFDEIKNINRSTGRPAFKKPISPEIIRKILPRF